jgi:hypothetical protein
MSVSFSRNTKAPAFAEYSSFSTVGITAEYTSGSAFMRHTLSVSHFLL